MRWLVKRGVCGGLGVALLIVGVGQLNTGALGAQTEPTLVKLAEPVFRSMAVTKPSLDYPRKSLEKGSTGVGVAVVTVGIDGHVEQADILEAPDAELKEALHDALVRWRFTPLPAAPDSPKKLRMQGKLVFYFTIEAGKGVVKSVQGQAPPASAEPGARGSAPTVQQSLRQVGSNLAKEIDETQFKQIKGPKVIDVRNRDTFGLAHRPAALNIPLDELRSRSQLELSKSDHVVIDCTQETLARCRLAAQILSDRGLTDMSILIR